MVQSSRRPGLGTAGSVPRPDGCARVHTRPPTTCRPPTPLPRSASAASCGVSPLALLPCERSLEVWTRRHSMVRGKKKAGSPRRYLPVPLYGKRRTAAAAFKFSASAAVSCEP